MERRREENLLAQGIVWYSFCKKNGLRSLTYAMFHFWSTACFAKIFSLTSLITCHFSILKMPQIKGHFSLISTQQKIPWSILLGFDFGLFAKIFLIFGYFILELLTD